MQQALTLKKHPEHRLQTLRLFIYFIFLQNSCHSYVNIVSL